MKPDAVVNTFFAVLLSSWAVLLLHGALGAP